jgi:hypothetical protein
VDSSMGRRSRLQTPWPRTHLLIPRGEAATKLQERIDEALEIGPADPSTPEDRSSSSSDWPAETCLDQRNISSDRRVDRRSNHGGTSLE